MHAYLVYCCPSKSVLIGQALIPGGYSILLSPSRFDSCIYPIQRKVVFDSEVEFSGKLAAGLSQQLGDLDIKCNVERFLMLKLS